MEPQHPGDRSFASTSTSPTGGIGDVKQTATSMVGQAKEQVSTHLRGQFNETAEGLEYAAGELHHVAQELRQKEQVAPIGQVADLIAEQIEHFASYVKDKDLDQLVADVERFAREKPAIFIGSAFALGLFAARLMKISSQGEGATRRTGIARAGSPGTRPGWIPSAGADPQSVNPAAPGTSSPSGVTGEEGSGFRQSA